MKKILKKNQVIITALAIMIAVAGYLNFTSDDQVLNTSVENMESEGASGNSDDDIVSAAVEDTINGEEYANTDQNENDEAADEKATENEGEELAQNSVDEDGEPINSETVGEAVLTGGAVALSEAKLNKEQTRSKAKELLLEIINNENLSDDAKEDAINKMLAMTENMEKESAAETQLAAKGFANAVVNISSDSVDVTVNAAKLSDQQRTQIENIITRKTGCEVQDIIITTMQ
ncbi:MAG: SpoIIIAH-like family protein [Lachnospiraceae bacterium]|nr:SpoIIIAH-like family protein [Lachnospiraceae bacterium]